MLGHDPQELGFRPDFRAGEPSRLLLPSRIPGQMRSVLSDFLSSLGSDVQMRVEDISMPGSVDVATLELGRGSAHPGQDDSTGPHANGTSLSHGGGQADGDEHGEDGMDDMMAIVGEPSQDGLIVETLRIRCGPFGLPFPGGLAVDATLDGEIVCQVRIETLDAPEVFPAEVPEVPDPLAPVAWQMAIDFARNSSFDEPGLVTRLELERAVSHLAWLRSLSRLLGWQKLTRKVAAVLAELIPVMRAINEAVPAVCGDRVQACLERAESGTSRLIALLAADRILACRLAGQGFVSPERAEECGLSGPNARASGLSKDRRTGRAVYERLGFEPLSESRGDAAARTLLRAREASQSLDLARRSLICTAEEGGLPAGESAAVEGPRGGLLATPQPAGWTFHAPGASAARQLAVETMTGRPWQDALVILASFDISPWAADR